MKAESKTKEIFFFFPKGEKEIVNKAKYWIGSILAIVAFFALGLFLIRDSKLQKCIERYENE